MCIVGHHRATSTSEVQEGKVVSVGVFANANLKGFNAKIADAWTAFLILILGAGLLFAYLRNKISAQIVLVAFTLITLVDLWRVDKRYLNDDKFTEATSIEDNYAPSEIDRQL